MTSAHTLVIGGARSGKSGWAEKQALASGREVIVIVTARRADSDAEMAERIARHQAQRPSHWRVLEAPIALAKTLQAETTPERIVIVDCLTLWLSNVLASAEDEFQRERQALLDGLPRLRGPVLLIGNEVGHGIVPLGAATRRFVDENGRLHQALAERCSAVRFVMAGCVLALKG